MNETIIKILACAEVRRILSDAKGVNIWDDVLPADDGTDFTVKMSSKIKDIAIEYFYIDFMNIQWF